ncbi:MAG: 1-acyl-sn-glycerol-3-phosphate acyltransferase [Deltaproteobacteria bacterium]|nr:1-acyl-sn-glycerol-3-phosphate acyltransferase [Deltaproteobacteria bacterium]
MAEPLAPLPPRIRGLAGRGMPRKLGPILSAFAERFLDRIPFPAAAAERLRAAVRAGAVVVYVHRARSPVEHLALARVVARDGLPRARYVGGLNVGGLQPFWALPAVLAGMRGPGFEETLLERCVRAGLCAEIFLRRPLTLLSATTSTRARFMEVLVRAQRASERPIVLVPLLLALKQRPSSFEPTPLDALFGTVEEPGLLRALSRVVAAGDAARFEVSEPVELRTVLREQGEAKDEVIAKKVRWSILHHLARAERVVHGPPLKSHGRLRLEVLRDPGLSGHLDELAGSSGLPRRLLDKRASKMLDEIAARPDIDVTRALSWILDRVWSRIYEGIHVDAGEIERVRLAARRGPIVFVPSHRSHIDSLVLSQALLKAGLMPPLLAAGETMDFFPMGALFRRCGAYFLRRAFKGDALYVAVFRAYVKKLFTEGFSQGFYIEGTRSRTGKTLPPKLGLLSMLVDAFLDSKEPDAIFVPCHIAYERVIEARAYAGELHGQAKEKESAAALVKSASVLGGRYGHVFISFDEAISLAEHLSSRGLSRQGGLEDSVRRVAVQTLGHKIVYGINRAGIVTATALVAACAVGLRLKGLDEAMLLQTATALLAHLRRKPAGAVRFEPGLADGDVETDLKAALDRLVGDGLLVRTQAGERIIVQAAVDAALRLEVFKNQVLHPIVPEAIIAAALYACGARPGNAVSRAEVAQVALALSRALKIEFIYRPGTSFPELFDDAVANAAAAGFVSASGDTVVLAADEVARAARRFAHGVIANFLEAYAVCIRAALSLASGAALSEKVLVQRLLEALKAAALTGELSCAESASKANAENVVALLVDMGALARGETGLRIDENHRGRVDEMLALLSAARLRR